MDWTGGLNRWTDIFVLKMLSNETEQARSQDFWKGGYVDVCCVFMHV